MSSSLLLAPPAPSVALGSNSLLLSFPTGKSHSEHSYVLRCIDKTYLTFYSKQSSAIPTCDQVTAAALILDKLYGNRKFEVEHVDHRTGTNFRGVVTNHENLYFKGSYS